MNTTDVENFPGFPDGIMGPDLMDNMRAQAERFGAELVTDDVIAVDLTGDDQDRHGRRAATSTARRPSSSPPARATASSACPSEKRLSGHGVSWCATCDGFFFRDQDIVVVGGGDSAMEEATFLTRFATHGDGRPPPRRAARLKIMQERAFADPKIRFAWNSEVVEILGDDKVSGVRLRDTETGEERDLAGDRPVRRDRPRPAQRALQGPGRPRRRGLHQGRRAVDPHQPPRRLRRRRRRRPHLPPGDHRRRHRLRRRARRRALPHRPRGRRDDRRPRPAGRASPIDRLGLTRRPA